MEPPAAEMCVFLLRGEEEEERRKEVGCQWESPADRKEVGCQSETAERRDAAVQVDLLSQQLTWRQTDSSAMLLQCFAVRPDGPDGGALLQHCTSNNKQSQLPVKHPTILCPSPSTRHIQSRSRRIQRKKTQPKTKERLMAPSSSTSSTHKRLRRRRVSSRPHPPPPTEDEEEVQQQEEEEEDEEEVVEEEVGDPTWTPPMGEAPPPPPSPSPLRVQQKRPDRAEQQEALQDLKVELEGTVCDVCGKVMRCKSSLARHSFIHTGKKPYGCHLCQMRFNRRDNLQHHLSRLHPNGVIKLEKCRADVQMWLCEVCGKTFNCRSRLRTHEVIHSGLKPYRCDLCPKAYMRTNDLEHHKKIVHIVGTDEFPKPSSLLCDFCGKEFKCKSQLAIHFQTHTGERPHLCDICGRKFGRSYQLKRHKILVHVNRANGEEGPGPDLPFICMIHTGEKPHRCGVCLRSFLRASCLKQHHIRVHLKMKVSKAPQSVCRRNGPAAAKAFLCPICSKVFKFKSLLASHSVIHTEIKPHACEFCSRCFRRLSHLKRHHKKCKSQLARHVIIHTGERPYACDLCPATFNRSGNLQQHNKRMHSVEKPPAEEATSILLDENGVGLDSLFAADLPYKQEETVVTAEGLESAVTCEIDS
ncbi:hypothetical protein LDENG_00038980 [Lucifuga dentata]|nr:hypothetical protein LDENG_00038980 [Lucifuga dentata]